jgi:citrate lyase subunit beta/citryl-CoA lyase
VHDKLVNLRSLLFVPGDRPDRMEKAKTAGADAVILDLEDAVASERKAEARTQVARFLNSGDRRVKLFVRINALDTDAADADLREIARMAPDGYVLPKSGGAASVIELARRLGLLHCQERPVLPIAAETPSSVFTLIKYREVGERLAGLTWGAEDLPRSIGATASRLPDGGFTPAFELVRTLTLFAAHAAGVPAIEAVYPAFKDQGGLALYAARAARDGFSGMLAIHPSQVPLINAAFTPSAEALEQARNVVAAFQSRPGAGSIDLGGVMLDAAHLKHAERVIARADDINK